MATAAEYDAVAAVLLAAVTAAENSEVPEWERGWIPATLIPKIATLCAKAGVDAIDAYRKAQGS